MFVIADVTEMSANVFYEIGFAEGFCRPVILTTKQGTVLPFEAHTSAFTSSTVPWRSTGIGPDGRI